MLKWVFYSLGIAKTYDFSKKKQLFNFPILPNLTKVFSYASPIRIYGY